jgi:hypothetical protein
VNVRSFSLVALLALAPVQAEAAGLLLARGPSGEVQIKEARSALSRGPARSTAWHQLLLQGGNAAELLWLLPVPPGAAVDVAATSFFDGLEEATAPRVLAPSGSPPGNQACLKPSPEVVTSGEGGSSPLALLGQEVFSEPGAVAPGVEKLGYSLSSADAAALGQALGGGGRLLALRLQPPLAEAATITVRIHGNGVDLGALPLLRSSSQAVPFVLWLAGSSRGKVQGVGEVEMEPSALRWLTSAETNYASLRRSMLEKSKGANVVLEVAGPGPLRDLTALPGGNDIPAFLDAYLRRAFERGEASGDLGSASDKARDALDDAHPDGCPRGDLLPPEGFSCALPGTQAPLVPSPGADDLSFVYPGNAALRWVSRVAGLVPAAGALPQVSASFPGGDPVSVLLTPASVWDGLCSPVTPGGQGGSSGIGGKNGGSGAGGPGPSGIGGSGGSEAEESDLDTAASAVDAGCSCANVFVGESCNGSSSDGSDGDAESCNCNDTSSTGEDSSSEGCSCGDSSSDGEGDSCSGSDSSSGDSCSGSEGSGGSDACGSSSSGGGESCGKDCSVSRRGRRPPRLSKWLVLAAAAALPLRRWTRPRDRKRRKEFVAG